MLLAFSMRLNAVLMTVFYFIFGLNFSIGNANVITSAIEDVSDEFSSDVNALFTTAFQFGGATGTTLFSTVIAVAQSGADSDSASAVRQATTMGGTWVFAIMSCLALIALAAILVAFRLRARHRHISE